MEMGKNEIDQALNPFIVFVQKQIKILNEINKLLSPNSSVAATIETQIESMIAHWYNEEYNLCCRMVRLYRKHKDKKEIIDLNYKIKVESLLKEANSAINDTYNNKILKQSVHPNTLIRFFDLSQHLKRDCKTLLAEYWDIAQDIKKDCSRQKVQAHIIKAISHAIRPKSYSELIEELTI